MKVEFLADYLTIFGFHKKGECIDVPDAYASIFTAQGIAKKPDAVGKPAQKAVRRRAVRKA